MRTPVKNFHVPLSEELYSRLRDESAASGSPATELVRQAVEVWLNVRRKQNIKRKIVEYAMENRGTECDIDEELENVSIENLNESDTRIGAR